MSGLWQRIELILDAETNRGTDILQCSQEKDEDRLYSTQLQVALKNISSTQWNNMLFNCPWSLFQTPAQRDSWQSLVGLLPFALFLSMKLIPAMGPDTSNTILSMSQMSACVGSTSTWGSSGLWRWFEQLKACCLPCEGQESHHHTPSRLQ